MARIEASPTAAHLMANIPGLRRRVDEALAGVLEAAMEIQRLQDHKLIGTNDHAMRLRVGNFMVSYLLDVEHGSAKVVYVEMITREGHGSGSGTEVG
jgi:hypothetical protein